MKYLNEIESVVSDYWSDSVYAPFVSLTLLVGAKVIGSWTIRYDSDGKMILTGMEEVVRAYMDANNLTIFRGTFQLVSEKGTVAESGIDCFLYQAGRFTHGDGYDADTFLAEYFITPLRYAITTPGNSFALTYYDTVTSDIILTYTHRDGTASTSVVASTACSQYRTAVLNIAYRSDCSKVDIAFGSRKFTVYFVDIPDCRKYYYLNFFNAEEIVSFPASITRIPNTEFETACFNKKIMRYDISHGIEHNVKTPPLPAAIIEQLYWMCRSRQVKATENIFGGEEKIDINITDYKLEESSNPNTPHVFEMSFEYADTQMANAVFIS